MKPKGYVGLRAKIATYTIVCVIAVGLVSNLFLYQYMQHIIEGKVANIDRLYAQSITDQLDYALERVQTLGFYCANAPDVVAALRNPSLVPHPARNAALSAQDAMNSYLRTSPIDSFINKLVIFNDDGVIVHALSAYSGMPRDYQTLKDSEQYRRWVLGDYRPFDRVYHSLNPGGKDCFVLWSEVYAPSSNATLGHVYAEVDLRLVTAALSAYSQDSFFFIRTAAGDLLTADGSSVPAEVLPAGEEDAFSFGGETYSVQRYPLQYGALTLSGCINQTVLRAGNKDVLFSIGMVSVMIITLVTAILVILTHHVTQPINNILDKINRIALNDYSFDPELERPNNEMGLVGAQLNELGLAVQKLLDESIALHDERAEIEMALLQSQVNPHFLYNTLNSVHWMAVMQKNPGIEKVVHSLVNLLKNVSKGVSDHIPLSGELALLDDYVSIQSVRYIGAFEYVCTVPAELMDYRIIKFTLQPLVENAIFHGVVPKGSFGTITVDARDEGEHLVITVTDDGVGMTPEAVEALLKTERRPDKSSMSGIGVFNVNRRLKLAYGRGCGLSVESELGAYTRVSVRIPKELEGGVGHVPDPAGG